MLAKGAMRIFGQKTVLIKTSTKKDRLHSGLIKRFDPRRDLETREGESRGIWGRDENNTDVMDGKLTVDMNPTGRVRGMGKVPRRPGQGTRANRVYRGVTSWGSQVRALRAMSGESRVLTSGGSSGQWSPTEIKAGGSGVLPRTQSKGGVTSSAPPGERVRTAQG